MVIRLRKWINVSVGLFFVFLGLLFLSYGIFHMDWHTTLLQNKVNGNPAATAIDREKPMLALTFDDGPYAPSTCRILDALKAVDGRATFFVVGSRVKGREQTVLKILESGCEIGNHTFDHVALQNLSTAEMQKQIAQGDAAIRAVTGKDPTLIRPPGGAYSKNLLPLCNRPLVLWTVDTMDWSHQNPQKTVQKVLKEAKDGDIILMHDLFVPTAEAVEILVPELQKRGFQLVTVSELLENREEVSGVIPCEVIEKETELSS